MLCLLPTGKWFVSTGKDNLLNAWRTPYGASIFQVPATIRVPLLVLPGQGLAMALGVGRAGGNAGPSSRGPFQSLHDGALSSVLQKPGLGHISGTHSAANGI